MEKKIDFNGEIQRECYFGLEIRLYCLPAMPSSEAICQNSLDMLHNVFIQQTPELLDQYFPQHHTRHAVAYFPGNVFIPWNICAVML